MNTQIRCPYCLGTKIIKKGLNSTKKKKRYECGCCKRKFVINGGNWYVSDTEKTYIDKLLGERIALRGIVRVIGISLSWLLAYIEFKYAGLPDDLNFVSQPEYKTEGGKIYLRLINTEMDEMWSFVGEKENKQWIWIALCGKTRQIIAFHVGGRGREDARLFWEKIPEEIRKNTIFHTDNWEAYKGVISQERHCYSTQKKYTNHIERFNNTLRQRASRLVRETLSFSKKLSNHIGAIKYFFCLYNLEIHKKVGLNL
jgi:insertion element IS1 protein InsB